jgi:hypothetical protein
MFWKKSSRRSRGAELGEVAQRPEKRDRVVTAHFMVSCSRNYAYRLLFLTTAPQLGNTYPYVAEDWHENFRLAEETGM